MSWSPEITLPFADGQYSFALRIKQLVELQEQTGIGPFVLLRKLFQREMAAMDVVNIIRLGLIGGGMTPGEAVVKVQRYVEERPLGESVYPASLILAKALVEPAESDLGKEEAAAEPDEAPIG